MSITIISLYLFVINSIAFALYAYDKRCAMDDAWRVSESTLLSVAFAGGSLGAYIGMFLLHHKTRHLKFQITIPVLLTIHLILLISKFY